MAACLAASSRVRATYNAAFSDGSGPRRIGAVTPVDVERFKAWLRGGDTMKRLKTASRQKWLHL